MSAGWDSVLLLVLVVVHAATMQNNRASCYSVALKRHQDFDATILLMKFHVVYQLETMPLPSIHFAQRCSGLRYAFDLDQIFLDWSLLHKKGEKKENGKSVIAYIINAKMKLLHSTLVARVFCDQFFAKSVCMASKGRVYYRTFILSAKNWSQNTHSAWVKCGRKLNFPFGIISRVHCLQYRCELNSSEISLI